VDIFFGHKKGFFGSNEKERNSIAKLFQNDEYIGYLIIKEGKKETLKDQIILLWIRNVAVILYR
jgi:hypothetical protein